MELMKKNIHMDRIKCRASSQITLEDDRNVPDQKPDMERILLTRGRIRTEELKAGEDRVSCKGKLEISILYMTEEGTVSRMDGQLPFEEQIYMEGVRPGDNVEIQTELEDLSIETINSRKISVRALLSLTVCVEELYDEELATELYHEDCVETKKILLPLAEIAVQKKDILRLKEEMEMPQSFPNIFEILWEDVTLNDISFAPADGGIRIQGEIRVFLLYEGEGEERPLKCFEKSIPFEETLECQGCMEMMIPDISCHISHSEVEVRADFDGEERIACLDMALDLEIRLYREEETEVLSDAYGVSRDVQVLWRQGSFNRHIIRASGKTKVAGVIKLPAGMGEVGELYNSSADIMQEEIQVTQDGVSITGALALRILYLAADGSGLQSLKTELPFSYELEAAGMTDACRFRILPSVSQLAVSRLGGGELDVKALAAFSLLGICSSQEDVIAEVMEVEGDTNVTKDMPGIIVHVARAGEELWGLGKKYYVPLQRLRELNHLSTDTLKEGEKVLIVR